MGNICGIDMFEELMSKQGEDFTKLIVGEKSKEFVGQKSDDGKKEVSKQIGDYKKQVFGEIEKEETKFDEEVKKAKGMLPQSLPSGMGSPDELLGINAFKEKFSDLKKEVDTKFGDAEKQAHTEMGKVKDSSYEEISNKQPVIPIYSNLPEREKQKLLKRGEKEFGPQIQKATQEQQASLMKKLDPSVYMNKIKNIVSMDSISGITTSAKSKFENAAKLASGGGISNFF